MATLVVVALTGFTTGRSHGHSKSRGGSGGGCSSSSQKHDSSSSGYSGSGSGYTRHTRHGSTSNSTSSASTLRDGRVKLLTCADARRAYATVEVTNPNSERARFDVRATFLDASGATVTSVGHEVTVPAKGRATAKVPVGSADLAAEVDRCDIAPDAYVRR
ncbi:hypothetical protein [Streptomyces sp. NPDC051684]|uniref:hypothetical protein n=1 Tax=Streptomyces sp. NPDC051684 TaxID=3365670 RepID=UPI0037B2EF5A